jgi:hypothetical protein
LTWRFLVHNSSLRSTTDKCCRFQVLTLHHPHLKATSSCLTMTKYSGNKLFYHSKHLRWSQDLSADYLSNKCKILDSCLRVGFLQHIEQLLWSFGFDSLFKCQWKSNIRSSEFRFREFPVQANRVLNNLQANVITRNCSTSKYKLTIICFLNFNKR